MARGPKRNRHQGNQNGAARQGVGATSPYILDKLLIPRVLAHAKNNSLTDVDAVAAALRQTHKEYQRRPQAAFRQMVAKAIQAVQARGGDQEDQQGGNSGSGSGESSSCSSSDEDGDSKEISSSGNESDDQEGREEPHDRGGVNNMLVSMYARTPQPESDADRAGPGPSSIAASAGSQGEGTRRKRARSPPAFAPPEAIVAAAAQAAQAVKKGRTEQTPGAVGRTSAGTGMGVAESMGQKTAPVDGVAVGGAGAGAGVGVGTATTSGATDGAAAAGKTAATPAGGGAGAKRGGRKAEGAVPASVVKRTRRGGGGFGGVGGGMGGGGGSAVVSARPVTYADLGGVEDVLADIRELIEYPLKHPEVYAWLGVDPPRGVLLHGPPGCGKTALANAIANECGVPFLRVSAPEIVSGMSGESEAKLRGLFQEAAELAPCIVFIDEIDAIAPKRETAQREMERRIVAQMLTCMDDLASPLPIPDASNNQPPQQTNTSAPPSGGTSDAPDASAQEPPSPRPHVVVIGATNRPDALDPALRRAGRFDREITLGIPTEAARAKILRVITRRLRLEGDFDFLRVAKRTPGFVGADLMALVKEAAALAVTRIFTTMERRVEQGKRNGNGQGEPRGEDEDAQQRQQQAADVDITDMTATHSNQDIASLDKDGAIIATSAQGDAPATTATTAAVAAGPLVSTHGGFGTGPLGPAELAGLAISMADFEVAVSKVQPSVRREGFTTTPDVTWEDVGSLDEVREELSFSITQPVLHPEQFEAMGMTTAMGVLLYGPPGCGKTLVAKAVASESGANFISIKGPELLNKYVGESERAVRQLFTRARAAQPCVLFFDELDALAPRRGTDTNQAAERVVNQLLTEMDGVDGRQGVFVVAATNRPDMIDPALLRPGRLGKVLFVPLPPPDGRAAILKALVRRTPMAPDVDVVSLGNSERCAGFSGADLAALVREASVSALKESLKKAIAHPTPSSDVIPGQAPPVVRVHMHHFESALSRMSPSVSRKDARMYEALRKSLRGNLRSRLAGDDPSSIDPIAPLEPGLAHPPASVAGHLPGQGGEGAAGDAANPGEDGMALA